MPSIHKSILAPYSANAMFDLIDKVEHYPEFLPWCENTTIHSRTETVTDATIEIRYRGLKTRFRTRNEKSYPHDIHMHFVEGPFHRLGGSWCINEFDNQACKIVFSLDYEFSNNFMGKMIKPIFNEITRNFIQLFIKQAGTKTMYE